MPSGPEFAKRSREIRPAKPLAELDAEDARRAERHVGISGEIAINLKREEIERQHAAKSAVAVRRRVDRVDKHRKPVGDKFMNNPHRKRRSPEIIVSYDGVGGA